MDIDEIRAEEARWKSATAAVAHVKEEKDAVSITANLSETSQSPSKAVSTRHINLATSTMPKSMPTPVALPDLGIDPLLNSLEACPWSGSNAPFAFLSNALISLSGTRSRILILNILTNTLRYIIAYDPASLTAAVYLLSNSLGPAYQTNTELNIGGSVLSKALLATTSLTPAKLRHLYHQHGDPGDVAFHAKTSVRTLVAPSPLTIQGLYDKLLAIAGAKGQGVVKRKEEIVRGLLVQAQGEEVRWVYRILSLNLRVGAVRNTLLQAVARAFALSQPEKSMLKKEDDEYVPEEIKAQVLPPPKGKKKAPPDPARTKATEILLKAEGTVKRTYAQHPNYGHIIRGLLNGRLGELPDRVPLTVGVPLLPTLGSPMRSLEEIYDRLSGLPFAAEMKYDGQRAQVHVSVLKDSEDFTGDNGVQNNQFVVDIGDGRKASVRMFSRHLEDMTDKYPDVLVMLASVLARNPSLESFILDSEIVALDPATGSLKSFQELSNRARKDVKLEDVKVSVGLFVFDLLYLNGQPLLSKTFRERRATLRQHLPPYTPQDVRLSARLEWVESVDSEDGEDVVLGFWEQAVAGKYEGLMLKILDSGEVLDDDIGVSSDAEDSPKKKGKKKVQEKEEEKSKKNGSRRKPLPATYEPDKRTMAWLKLKKDYVLTTGDSLDLIPIGAWHGNGRKARWWSPILLGVWDENEGRPVALCKCMSGFTDVFYKSLNERYQEGSDTCSRTPLWDVETSGYSPSVYFKPQEVWEVRGADITISPTSVTAKGMIDPERGLSLRFPRFMKLREDKGIMNASTPEDIAHMYRQQEARGDGRNAKATTGMDDGELIDVPFESDAVNEESSGAEDQKE
ncbi:ATP-dependent DNA ligase [Dacryopinax primogenitus]|uniref:ATP-dependent DNA ligase n=1 Tax=Dacryopinax primogenitus (strain DJM 731) TaxID=1858805 RepID=M5FND9_DACPD|nr:ATP-dependent DNA ligase [Dacryopinax primogenitus]EJT97275.1 ATP-dependent DNA ligase [Dacryopinax primogenitus]